MTLRYAIIEWADAWVLFRDDVALVSFENFDQAINRARGVAMAMSSEEAPVELLLHDRFGELRSEWFASGAPAHARQRSPGAVRRSLDEFRGAV